MAKLQLTPQDILRLYGREPGLNDYERIVCLHTDPPTHALCGICPEHNFPRVWCECGIAWRRAEVARLMRIEEELEQARQRADAEYQRAMEDLL